MGFKPSVGMGQIVGKRQRQEDCIARFPEAGDPVSLVVLSDGMGGAAGGDLASRLIVESVLREFAETTAKGGTPDKNVLRLAATRANKAIRAQVAAEPDLQGMGGTLVAVQLLPAGFVFFSMGDSPLYLVRGGTAHRMNADHSIGGLLDAAVARGEMSQEAALARRDRNRITSVIMGEPLRAMRMDETMDIIPTRRGDVIILASDGLDTLSPGEIAALVREADTPVGVVDKLLQAIEAVDRPRQDNASVIAIAY